MDTLAPESTRQNLRSQRLNLLTNEPHQRLESLVKSKEPISVMCQFVPNLLNTVSLLPSPSLFVSVWHIGFDDFSTHYPSLNHVRRSSID